LCVVIGRLNKLKLDDVSTKIGVGVWCGGVENVVGEIPVPKLEAKIRGRKNPGGTHTIEGRQVAVTKLTGRPPKHRSFQDI